MDTRPTNTTYLLESCSMQENIPWIVNNWHAFSIKDYQETIDYIWNSPYTIEILTEIHKKNLAPQSPLLLLLKAGVDYYHQHTQSVSAAYAHLIPLLSADNRRSILSYLLFCDETGMFFIDVLTNMLELLANQRIKIQMENEIIDICINQFNIYFLIILYNISPDVLKHIKNPVSNEPLTNFLSTFQNYTEEDLLFLSSLMCQFTYDTHHPAELRRYRVDKTKYTGALLTFAQMQSRKSYDVTCTIILDDHKKKSDIFFQTLSQTIYPFRERFIITGEHWISGETWIDENNNAHLLLIDSLGDHFEFLPRNFIENFNFRFPLGKIYLSMNQRQRSITGCPIYAIDDCTKLFTAESFLPDTTEIKGMASYLANHTNTEVSIYFSEQDVHVLDYIVPIHAMNEDSMSSTTACSLSTSNDNLGSFPVSLVKLPIRFLSTTQSYKDLQCMTKLIESPDPINKKGQTLKEVVEASCIKHNEKKRNNRLENKKAKIAQYNLEYLYRHSDLRKLVSREELVPYTVKGFKARH